MTCICKHSDDDHWMSHEGTTVCNICNCPNYKEKEIEK